MQNIKLEWKESAILFPVSLEDPKPPVDLIAAITEALNPSSGLDIGTGGIPIASLIAIVVSYAAPFVSKLTTLPQPHLASLSYSEPVRIAGTEWIAVADRERHRFIRQSVIDGSFVCALSDWTD